MDIDIDLPSTFKPLDLFPEWVRASIYKDEKLNNHPCGYYPQSIPRDPISKLSAIPYKEAEELGYYKIDFLHLHIYDYFKSRSEIDELLKIEPDWSLLESPSVVTQLFQLSKHYGIIQKIKPKSILEIADVIALIRPGKMFLIKKYQENKLEARKYLYSLDTGDSYGFKKSHAIAYAYVIVLQLHLISIGINFKGE